MSRHHPVTRLALLVALLALAAVAAASTAAAAPAKDGRDLLVRGSCTAGATAKLKLSPENGRVEIEFEVDQNRNGIRWLVTLRRNGVVIARRAAVTRAPSGSFEVRHVAARAGATSRWSAVATRPTGARCSAAATF